MGLHSALPAAARAALEGHALPARTCSSSGRCGSTGTKRRPRVLRSAKSASDPDTNSWPVARLVKSHAHRALLMNSGVSKLLRFLSLNT